MPRGSFQTVDTARKIQTKSSSFAELQSWKVEFRLKPSPIENMLAVLEGLRREKEDVSQAK